MTTTTCRACGSTAVVWKQSKAGKYYLANEHAGIRGSVYTTPHFKNCAAKNAERMAAIDPAGVARTARVAEFNVKAAALMAAGDIDGIKALYAAMDIA
jgi:hypothetical protein